MAIELFENADTATLEVKLSGRLSADNYKTFAPGVVKFIEDCGKIKILVVMHDFHGWDMGGVWEDIKFATNHCKDVKKIAMVGEDRWEKWMAAICKPFTLSSIKYFDFSKEDAARAWLDSGE